MGDDNDDGRYAAMVEFLGTFPALSSPPQTLSDLSDGVALFEALSEIAPSHFDPSTIARHLGENWALKSSNLRKLLRNLEHYYHEQLSKTADFAAISVSDIARGANLDMIATLFELVAAAAISCDDRAEFVGRIMSLSGDSQLHMKSIIECGLERVMDYSPSDENSGDDDDDDDEKELVFDNLDGGDDDDDGVGGLGGGGGGSLWGGAPGSIEEFMEVERERDDLREQLSSMQAEVAKYKNELSSSGTVEEVESDNRRLRDLTSDLQERLERTTTSLSSAEEEASRARRQVEEATSAVEEMKDKNTRLEDELDVANAKANQLRKAEAMAVAYRKKLESVGVMSQQMQELEDQSANYLRQIIDLETSNKQVPVLQKKVESMKEEMRKRELEFGEGAQSLKAKEAEITQLKADLGAAESSKRMYEEEIADLRIQQENNGSVGGGGLGDDDIGGNMSFTSAKSVKETREKMIRLEHENESLKKQLASVAPAGPGQPGGVAKNSVEFDKLMKEKDETIAKVSSDKAKLEAYTKKTLAKFQQKYMVALQECKAKLKEKHDRIEQLEAEKESEKAAQKKEATLLSSTVYELGLAIMQNKLSQR